jgi:hypothetical protein
MQAAERCDGAVLKGLAPRVPPWRNANFPVRRVLAFRNNSLEACPHAGRSTRRSAAIRDTERPGPERDGALSRRRSPRIPLRAAPAARTEEKTRVYQRARRNSSKLGRSRVRESAHESANTRDRTVATTFSRPDSEIFGAENFAPTASRPAHARPRKPN